MSSGMSGESGKPPAPLRGMRRREFVTACARCAGAAIGLGVAPSVLDVAGSSSAAWAAAGAVSDREAKHFTALQGTDVQCQLCPHQCTIKDGQMGKCGVRKNVKAALQTLVYGKPAKVELRAIEFGHVYHFLPGTAALFLGTAGCGLACQFCNEADIAKASPLETDNEDLPPDRAVVTAQTYGASAIFFSVNDPVQCFEYVIDTCEKAKEAGLRVVAQTAGYIAPGAMEELAGAVDALVLDLKCLEASTYRQITGGGDVQQAIAAWKVAREKAKWIELTYLVVPGYNERPHHITALLDWVGANMGADIPLHFLRFFPKYQLIGYSETPTATLKDLRKQAYKAGLKFVYIDGVPGDPGESTFCPNCKEKVIRRLLDPNSPRVDNLRFAPARGACANCNSRILGLWQ